MRGLSSLGLERRAFLAGLAAAALPLGRAARALPSGTGPVHHLHEAPSPWDARSLMAALRQAAGCMRVDPFQADTGRLVIWQEWSSAEACRRFWRAQGAHDRAAPLLKLEL